MHATASGTHRDSSVKAQQSSGKPGVHGARPWVFAQPDHLKVEHSAGAWRATGFDATGAVLWIIATRKPTLTELFAALAAAGIAQ